MLFYEKWWVILNEWQQGRWAKTWTQSLFVSFSYFVVCPGSRENSKPEEKHLLLRSSPHTYCVWHYPRLGHTGPRWFVISILHEILESEHWAIHYSQILISRMSCWRWIPQQRAFILRVVIDKSDKTTENVSGPWKIPNLVPIAHSDVYMFSAALVNNFTVLTIRSSIWSSVRSSATQNTNYKLKHFICSAWQLYISTRVFLV